MRNLIPERIAKNFEKGKYSDKFKCFSMFVDISGFTSTTEALMRHGQEGAEVLSDILKYLFEETVRAVYERGGYVTKFAGDAFTAIFEPAGSDEQTALNVLEAALITNMFFAKNKTFRSKYGDFEFGVKIGLGYGECYCGIAGKGLEKTYYFSGSAVDICAKAEHNASKGQIWASENFYRFVENVVKETGRNNLYGMEFFKIGKCSEFNTEISDYEFEGYRPETLYALAGESESEFPIGEFRDIVSVFISFKGEVDLNELMTKVYEIRSIYGGSHPVLDFGDKGGNILFFTGAPISYENNGARALNFVNDLFEWSDKTDGLQIRAGLAKGVVYCGFNGSELRNEFTCLGNTVNQSARFMMKADWGQIYTDHELSKCSEFRFACLGEMAYKGREKGIATFRMDGKLELKDVFFKGEFVGRTVEKKRLKSFLSPLISKSNCGVLYQDGDAGSGKSRLANQVRQEITSRSVKERQNVEWLYFVCDDIIKTPYNPLKYFLNRYFDLKGDDLKANREKIRKKIPAEMIAHSEYISFFLDMGSESKDILDQDPVERQNSVILSLILFFKSLNNNRSVIYEIDNASFADDLSIDFFKRLSVELKKHPAAFIFNCRYKDNGENYDFGFIKQKRLKIKSLKASDFKELVKNRLGVRSVPVETIELIAEKSFRNPFYAEQVIMYVKEKHLLDSKLKIVSGKEIPNGINQIMIARVDKLDAVQKEIVKTASVLGNEVDVDILAELLGGGHGILKDHLNTLESEDILIKFNEYSYLFKYSALREAVYGMQLKKILRELHNRAGSAIEYLHPENPEKYLSVLAFHFDNAENTDKALEYHKKAGYKLKEKYENRSASEHFERWDIIAKDHLKNDLYDNKMTSSIIEIGLIRFYFSFSIFHDIERSNKIIDDLLGYGERTTKITDKAQIMMDYANFLNYKGKVSEAEKYYNDAKEIYISAHDYHKLALINLSLGKNRMASGEADKALELYDHALKNASMVENPLKSAKVESSIYGDMGIIYDYSGDFPKALEYYGKQLSICEKYGFKMEMATVIGNIGVVYHLTGDLDKAASCYEKKLKLSTELGKRNEIALALNNIGYLYKDKGNYSKALRYFQKSRSISRELMDNASVANVSVNIGHVYKLMNDGVKSEKEYLKGIEISEKYSYKSVLAEGMVELADLYLLLKRPDEALNYADKGYMISKSIGLGEYISKGEDLIKKIKINQKL